MRKLQPLNRYLVVTPIECAEDAPQQQILMPPGTKIENDSFKTVKLLAANKESCLKEGTTLLVPSNMIEEVKLLNSRYYLVLENYVVGCFHD